MLKLYGVYKGKVVDNNDPKKIGRLKVAIPAAFGKMNEKTLPWAIPTIPYNDPPCAVGTLVWITFMHGDARYPVYTGFVPKEV